jgi:hypothetical protein
MCGGGGSDQYDAYKRGDFQKWKTIFDQRAAVQTALAKGEIDQATADAQLAAIANAGSGNDTGGGLFGDILAGLNGVKGANFDKLANKIKSDPSAAMEMREVMRQHDVSLGKIGIDKAFSNFGDGYYDGFKNDYTGFYFPQLDRQYGEAQGKTTAAMADRGTLDSSVGSNAFADLARQNAEARTNIANEGIDAANKLRGTVENAKSGLYSLNEASADPQAINAQAIGQATALVAPPVYSPLGQVFAGALNGLSSFQQARNNRATANYKSPVATGYGSGSVIR